MLRNDRTGLAECCRMRRQSRPVGWRAGSVCEPLIFVLVSLLVLFLASSALASESQVGHRRADEPAWWLVILFTLHGGVIWFFARRRYLVYRHGKLQPAFSELQEFSAHLLAGDSEC